MEGVSSGELNLVFIGEKDSSLDRGELHVRNKEEIAFLWINFMPYYGASFEHPMIISFRSNYSLTETLQKIFFEEKLYSTLSENCFRIRSRTSGSARTRKHANTRICTFPYFLVRACLILVHISECMQN